MADYSCTIYRKSRSWEKATWPEISNYRSRKTFLTGVMQKVYLDWEIGPGFQKGAVQKLFFAVKPIEIEKGWWHVAKHKIRHQQRTTKPDLHRRWRQQLPGQRAWTSSPKLCWYGSAWLRWFRNLFKRFSAKKRCVLAQFTSFYSHCKLLLALSKQTLRIFTQQMYKFLSPAQVPDLIPTQSIGSCLIPSLGNQSQLSFQVKLQPGSGWSLRSPHKLQKLRPSSQGWRKERGNDLEAKRHRQWTGYSMLYSDRSGDQETSITLSICRAVRFTRKTLRSRPKKMYKYLSLAAENSILYLTTSFHPEVRQLELYRDPDISWEGEKLRREEEEVTNLTCDPKYNSSDDCIYKKVTIAYIKKWRTQGRSGLPPCFQAKSLTSDSKFNSSEDFL